MKIREKVASVMAATVALTGAAAMFGAPAFAIDPSGGCWVYSPPAAAPIEDANPISNTSSSLAPWTDPAGAPTGPADYVLTTTGGATSGSTVNFSMTFNKGPKNGGPAASGTAYYYFSLDGTNLAPITAPFSAGGGAIIPGATIAGSTTAANAGSHTVTFRKVIYDIPLFSTRVQCNGQSGGTAGGTNPATVPLNTNVVANFTTIGPTATVSTITGQRAGVTGFARAGDVINVTGANWDANQASGAFTVTVGGAAVATQSLASDASGNLTGAITVPAGATTGAGAIVVTQAANSSTTPISILSTRSITITPAGGGTGTVVTVTVNNFDPLATISVAAQYDNPNGLCNVPDGPIPGQPCNDPVGNFPVGPFISGSNTTVTATTSSTGTWTGTVTVNEPATNRVTAVETGAGTSPAQDNASTPFVFNSDACTSKLGLATTGSCDLSYNLTEVITAGNLSMSRTTGTGNVTFSPITLDGTNQVASATLSPITVKDFRGSAFGWSLTASVTDFTGSNGGTIPKSALIWTPTCVPATGVTTNLVAATVGSPGAVDAATLCSVGVVASGTGGQFEAGAAMALSIPANQLAGSYAATLVLTLA